MDNYKNQIFNLQVICFFAVVSLLYFTYGQSFVPENFNWDSNTIKNGFLFSQDPNFMATTHFYHFFGFRFDTPIFFVQMFSWIIYIFFLFLVLKAQKKEMLSWYKICMISFFTISYGLYFATYSKDEVLLLFLLISIYLFIKTGKRSFIPISLIIYGEYYRMYWLMVIILFISLLLFKKRKIFYYPFSIILISIYDFFNKTQITSIRITPDSSIIASSYTKTIIFNLLPNTSFFTDIINYSYILISLIVPLQGIKSFNQIFYYVWIYILFYLYLKNRNNVDQYFLLMFLCFISIQAMFEPDFGSVFRHQMGIFPLVYFSIFKVKNT